MHNPCQSLSITKTHNAPSTAPAKAIFHALDFISLRKEAVKASSADATDRAFVPLFASVSGMLLVGLCNGLVDTALACGREKSDLTGNSPRTQHQTEYKVDRHARMLARPLVISPGAVGTQFSRSRHNYGDTER